MVGPNQVCMNLVFTGKLTHRLGAVNNSSATRSLQEAVCWRSLLAIILALRVLGELFPNPG